LTQENPTGETRRSSGWLSALLFFGAVALVIAGIAWLYPSDSGTGATADTSATTTAPSSVDVSVPSYVSGEEPVADAAEVILPSVVLIQTQSGLGSGVVYDSDGLIVTAAHVVQGSDTVRVRFSDGDQVSGEVIGTAPDVDIAVIKVDRVGLPAATFNTEKPRVGQLAVAVGSPWGLESTVTAGIISAVDQTNCSAETCASLVQTDAAINPGNSGGALVDRNGQVVGINVSILSNSGANDGVGFAVPSAIATEYADSIISGKPLETAFLGVRGADVETEGQAGAVITEVTQGSAAETAGIEVDDVIVAFDDVPVLGWEDLIAQVRSHQPGETLDVRVLRDGQEQIVTVTLGVRTEDVG
jgi:S1-C subfamily serine protease